MGLSRGGARGQTRESREDTASRGSGGGTWKADDGPGGEASPRPSARQQRARARVLSFAAVPGGPEADAPRFSQPPPLGPDGDTQAPAHKPLRVCNSRPQSLHPLRSPLPRLPLEPAPGLSPQTPPQTPSASRAAGPGPSRTPPNPPLPSGPVPPRPPRLSVPHPQSAPGFAPVSAPTPDPARAPAACPEPSAPPPRPALCRRGLRPGPTGPAFSGLRFPRPRAPAGGEPTPPAPQPRAHRAGPDSKPGGQPLPSALALAPRLRRRHLPRDQRVARAARPLPRDFWEGSDSAPLPVHLHRPFGSVPAATRAVFGGTVNAFSTLVKLPFIILYDVRQTKGNRWPTLSLEKPPSL